MTQTSTMFQNVLMDLSCLWENAQKEKDELIQSVQSTQSSLDEQCRVIDTLHHINKDLSQQLEVSQKEVDNLKKKVQEAEDDQKQFTKVSHIINMERENTHFKQQIAILERRVAFYQNQCNELKSQLQSQSPMNQSTQSTQTYTDAPIQDETTLVTDESQAHDEQEDALSVVEKKIKGVYYYVSDENDIYAKNEDESIGELKGKIEVLSSGKTKVKWYKS